MIKMKSPVKLYEIFQLIEVVTAEPTGKPKRFAEQFKIFDDSGTSKFCWYDYINDKWVYVSGTDF